MIALSLVAALVLLIASFLGSGILFKHVRFLTYVSAALTLWQTSWIFLSYASRTIFHTISGPLVFLIGSGAACIVWAFAYRQWKKPIYHSLKNSWWANGAPLLIILIALLATLRISSVNGPGPQGSWQLHGFFNGDTFMMAALVERSLTQTTLVIENPTSANGSLPYPSVLHAGMADFIKTIGIQNTWQHHLTFFTILQIILIVGMFFLLVDTMWKKLPQTPTFHIVSAATILLIMGYGWDDYVFAQSHLFLIAVELLLAIILLEIKDSSNIKTFLTAYGMGSVTALTLILSNSVLGTVGAAMITSFSLLFACNQKKPMLFKIMHGVLAVFWILIYKHFMVGSSALGGFHFSYLYVEPLMRLSPLIILFVIASWIYRKDAAVITVLAVSSMALAFIALFFSENPLLLDNAPRFLYDGLRVGFPLLIPLFIKAVELIKEQLTKNTNGLFGLLPLGAALSIGLLLLTLPAFASIKSAHYNLEVNDEHIVRKSELDALQWLKQHTTPNAIVIAPPASPWTIPYFTGRALLRAEDFWASSQDGTLSLIQAGMEGDKDAQKEALRYADYLFIPQDKRPIWEENAITKVYKNKDYFIYQVIK